MGIRHYMLLLVCCGASSLFSETLGATTSEVVKVISDGKFVHEETNRRNLAREKNPIVSATSDIADNLLCFGVVEGRTITFRYTNRTPNPVAFRMMEDFRYWLDYRNAQGASGKVDHDDIKRPVTMQVEILPGNQDLSSPCNLSSLRVLPLPKDCAIVDRLAVELEGISFHRLGECESMYELGQMFATNAFRKVVRFDSAGM